MSPLGSLALHRGSKMAACWSLPPSSSLTVRLMTMLSAGASRPYSGCSRLGAFVSNRPICVIVSDSVRCLLCLLWRSLGLSRLGCGCISTRLSSSNAMGEEQRVSFAWVLIIYARFYSTSTLASMTFYRSRDFCPVLR